MRERNASIVLTEERSGGTSKCYYRLVIKKVFNFLFGVYIKIKGYLYYLNFRKKHISYGFTKCKLQIDMVEHDDYMVGVRKKINKLAKNNSRQDFIRLALTEALKGCNFIIFFPADNENKYIQFWTGEGKLIYDFYANKSNRHTKYYLAVLGLLSEFGFVNKNNENYKGINTYKINKNSNFISIDVYFRKEVESASEFTEIVYREIFKIKNKKLIAEVA